MGFEFFSRRAWGSYSRPCVVCGLYLVPYMHMYIDVHFLIVFLYIYYYHEERLKFKINISITTVLFCLISRNRVPLSQLSTEWNDYDVGQLWEIWEIIYVTSPCTEREDWVKKYSCPNLNNDKLKLDYINQGLPLSSLLFTIRIYKS